MNSEGASIHAKWDAQSVEKELYTTDWTSELSNMLDMRAMVVDAFDSVTTWLNADLPDDKSGQDLNFGSALFGIYMMAFARALGYLSIEDMSEGAPDLTDMYREILFSMLAQGHVIADGGEHIIASPAILDYISNDTETEGD